MQFEKIDVSKGASVYTVKGRSKYEFEKMKVGESFLVPDIERPQIVSAASAFSKKNGVRLRVLRQKDGTYRCGRVA